MEHWINSNIFVSSDAQNMDTSQIKKHSIVQARNPGSTQGPFVVNIGIVDGVEGSKYIKLTENDALDGRHHWFPIDWVETVDEQTVYLNKPADKAMSELMDKLPT
jgi:hypothetical protein